MSKIISMHGNTGVSAEELAAADRMVNQVRSAINAAVVGGVPLSMIIGILEMSKVDLIDETREVD